MDEIRRKVKKKMQKKDRSKKKKRKIWERKNWTGTEKKDSKCETDYLKELYKACLKIGGSGKEIER